MSDARSRATQPRGLAIFGAAALVLIFLVALGVTLAIATSGDEDPPTDLAARVPADVEVFAGLDMDLAADRWMHLEELLQRLGVLDRAIEGRDEAFDEQGFDFDEEILPVLRDVEQAGAVVEYTGDADSPAQFAILLQTRDEPALLDLIERLQLSDEPRTEIEESHDEELDLAITEYLAPSGFGASDLVVASRDGIVYLGADADYLRDLVRRADGGETLDGVPEFERLADEADADALVFVYVDTQQLLQEIVDELDRSLGDFALLDEEALAESLQQLGEETAPALASTFSANDDGFVWELVVVAQPDEELSDASSARADIETAARATPAEARFFAAFAELGAQVQEQLTLAREEGGESADPLDEALGGFADDTGVDLERDLLPKLTGTLAFSLGIRTLSVDEPDFALLLTGTDDHEALARELERLTRFAERECDCELDVTIGERDGFSYVGWPDRRVESRLEESETLWDSEGFRDTLAMLPDDPQGLLYVDLGFVFDELLESGELPLDESNPDAIRGLGMSWSRDGDLARVGIAIPIEAAP